MQTFSYGANDRKQTIEWVQTVENNIEHERTGMSALHPVIPLRLMILFNFRAKITTLSLMFRILLAYRQKHIQNDIHLNRDRGERGTKGERMNERKKRRKRSDSCIISPWSHNKLLGGSLRMRFENKNEIRFHSWMLAQFFFFLLLFTLLYWKFISQVNTHRFLSLSNWLRNFHSVDCRRTKKGNEIERVRKQIIKCYEAEHRVLKLVGMSTYGVFSLPIQTFYRFLHIFGCILFVSTRLSFQI